MNFIKTKKINKFAGIILILVFAFSLFGSFVNNIHAGELGDIGKDLQKTKIHIAGEKIKEAQIILDSESSTDSEKQDAQNTIQDNKKIISESQKYITPTESAAWYDVGGQLAEVANNLFKKIAQAILGIVAWILWFSATTLNFVIDFSILKMGNFIKDTDAIKSSWTMIRDLINMLFIFGLLFISINLIIQGSGSNTKKLLTNIIAAALLINFSFFFTTVLIDVSNQTTIAIYDSIGSGCNLSAGETTESISLFGTIDDNGITNCFMNHLKLQTIYTPTNSANLDVSDLAGDFGNTLTVSFLSSIFIILAAVVFLAMALMLLFRFVSLLFILVASPVMFIGMIIPAWGNIQKMWMDTLKKNLLFPPVMFLMIKISLLILASGAVVKTGSTGTGSFRTLIQNGNLDALTGIIFQYLLALGFLIGSMIVAQQVGAAGAKWSTQRAGKFVMGGMAKLGRNTVGATARRMADSQSLQTSAKFGSNAATRFAARTALKYSDKTAKSSFDGRSGIASALKAANAPSIDLGKAQKGGFDKDVENKEKEYKATNKLMDKAKIPEERAKQIQEDLIKEAQKNPKSELGKSYTNIQKEIKEDTIKATETRDKAQSALDEAQMDVDTTPNNATPEQIKKAKDKLELAKQKLEVAKDKLKDVNDKEKDWVKNNASLYASKTLSPNPFMAEFDDSKLGRVGMLANTVLFQGQTRMAAKRKAADAIRKEATKSKDQKKKDKEDKKLDDILKNTKKDDE
jgi:hypothetical protein